MPFTPKTHETVRADISVHLCFNIKHWEIKLGSTPWNYKKTYDVYGHLIAKLVDTAYVKHTLITVRKVLFIKTALVNLYTRVGWAFKGIMLRTLLSDYSLVTTCYSDSPSGATYHRPVWTRRAKYIMGLRRAKTHYKRLSSWIARLVWPTWGPHGSCRPQGVPCWSHELCYQGGYELQATLISVTSSTTVGGHMRDIKESSCFLNILLSLILNTHMF